MIILFVFCSPQQNSIKIIDCLNRMSGYFCLNNPIHKQLRLTMTLAFWSNYTDMDHANLWVTKSLSGKRKKEPWDNWLLRVYFKRSQKERLRFRALPFFIVFAIDPDKQNKTKKKHNKHTKKEMTRIPETEGMELFLWPTTIQTHCFVYPPFSVIRKKIKYTIEPWKSDWII